MAQKLVGPCLNQTFDAKIKAMKMTKSYITIIVYKNVMNQKQDKETTCINAASRPQITN